MTDPGNVADDERAPLRDGLTGIFHSWNRGEAGAFDALFALFYEQLRGLAHREAVRARAGDTMRTTAVLHDAYLRLAANPRIEVDGREHFLSLAARAMRFVLVDHARRQSAGKRGGSAPLLPLERASGVATFEPSAESVLTIHRALERLAELDERQAHVFELRAFGGFGVDQVAEILGVATATVKRDWRNAKLFVARELTGEME